MLRLKTPVNSLQTMGRQAAIAEIGVGQPRYLLTTDGGHHWRRFRLRYPSSFATAKLGLGYHVYMVGNQGRMALLETRDGGKTWKRQRPPCQSMSALTDLVTARSAWLMCLGQGGAGNESKALYRTTDGGKHWTAKPKLVQPEVDFGKGGAVFPHGRAFVLVARGASRPARLLETQDYGHTWHTAIRWGKR